MPNKNKPDEGERELKCQIGDCFKRRKKGDVLCSMHRARLTRTGRLDKQTPLERLFKRVKIDSNNCWNYTAFLNESGYGRLRANGKKVLAHRFVYGQIHGAIKHGLCVCHSCDNPACVNPAHLWVGTDKDNTRDAIKKGRINPVQRAKRRWALCPTHKKQ